MIIHDDNSTKIVAIITVVWMRIFLIGDYNGSDDAGTSYVG